MEETRTKEEITHKKVGDICGRLVSSEDLGLPRGEWERVVCRYKVPCPAHNAPHRKEGGGGMIIEEAIRISQEVREEGGKAEEWLRHKCNWEHMSRTAVIVAYGDPRKVVAELAAEEGGGK